MSKKIIDLTEEEMANLCKKYHDCTRESGKVSCPLWYASHCLKGEIKKNRYLQEEVVL
jgi:hypothetical protein